MSSEQSPPRSFIRSVGKTSDRAFRKAYGTASSGGVGLGVGSQVVGDLAAKRMSETRDPARNLARLFLRTAMAIGQDIIAGTRELEGMLAGADDAAAVESPAGERTVAMSSSPVAVLPPVSPGQQTAVKITVRNDSPNTVDWMSLQCDGLFGSGHITIGGQHVRFEPDRFDLAPRSRTEVTCSVDVPDVAKLGHYTGLIEATGLPGVQMLVSLNVG